MSQIIEKPIVVMCYAYISTGGSFFISTRTGTSTRKHENNKNYINRFTDR